MRCLTWLCGMVAALCGASGAFAGCTIGKMADLPVVMRGTRPEVHARINGTDAIFLLDSGAFYSTLSPGSAAEFKLKVTPITGGFYLKGIGGSADAGLTTVKQLMLADITLRNIQFLVGGSETGGAGLLGQNVLHAADTEYDLRNGSVKLMRSTDCARSDLAYWAGARPYSMLPIEPTTIASPHTIGTVFINNVKLRALFDTGASESVVSLRAAASAGVRTTDPGVKPAGFSHGLGNRSTRVWTAPFADVRIGGEEIHNTHLRIGDIGDLADMLVGADFFLSHRIYVANTQHRMYFTYEGGPIFTAVPGTMRSLDADGKPLAIPVAPANDPTDAEGFARRSAALAARGDGKAALADMDRALALAPENPTYLLQRARLHVSQNQPGPALTDLDGALALKPDLGEALLMRASMRLAGANEEEGEEHEDKGKSGPRRRATPEDRSAALADLDAAAKALPPSADLRFALAHLYGSQDRFDDAIAQFDIWIADHPADSKRPMALNGRCRSRALAGSDLPKALADCNGAVRTLPTKGPAFDSRGLVRLRMGDAAGAVKDYDAALAINPRIAWSLYGRGVAKLRLGRKAEGEADLAAAAALAPGLARRAARLGIAP